MHGTLARTPRPRLEKVHIPLAVALFWLFTYALLSLRAQMVLGDSFMLIGLKRIVATSIGAIFFWLVFRRITSACGASPAKPIAVIATILPASLTVLAVRLLVDLLVYEQPLPLENNVRWVLVWAGYFGLCVSASLAMNLHANSQSAKLENEAIKRTAEVVPQRDASDAAEQPTVEALEWVVSAIAKELESIPRLEKAALLEALVSKAGYEVADDLDLSHRAQNARVQLVQRLVVKMRR